MIVRQKWMVGSLERKERMVGSLERKERMVGSLEKKDRWKGKKIDMIGKEKNMWLKW